MCVRPAISNAPLRATSAFGATVTVTVPSPLALAGGPSDFVTEALTPRYLFGEKHAAPGPPPAGTRALRHGLFVPALLFTPDGMTLISAGSDRRIRLWDPATGRELRRFVGHEAAVLSLALTADGRTLASGGSDGTVRLWDLADGKERQRFAGSRGQVAAVALAPDGSWLAESHELRRINDNDQSAKP